MKKRMVTRTVKANRYSVMFCKISTQEVYISEVEFPESYTEKQVLKNLREIDSNIRPVEILGKQTTETLYGMPEEDFIKYAQVLPPRFTTEEE